MRSLYLEAFSFQGDFTVLAAQPHVAGMIQPKLIELHLSCQAAAASQSPYFLLDSRAEF